LEQVREQKQSLALRQTQRLAAAQGVAMLHTSPTPPPPGETPESGTGIIIMPDGYKKQTPL
jgi:hypothetical protein